MDNYNPYFMRLALKNAVKAYYKNEVPVGCVIIRNNKIIAQAYNTKNIEQCVTRHAELIAIEQASKNKGSFILDDCEMYVTLEPCLMCIGAIIQSRIKKLYIGATDETMGSVISKIPIIKDELVYPYKLDYSFKKTISSKILTRFFKKIREKNKI
ncbi:nucleoside deaminase [Peptoanaerobacter stomatis]|uniref:CMP/dCMP-type deaminase domain-containing protein n=1 Tax=Peptoanaerobacter stomatis TaxID=796937 RepID=G9WZM1_9FIRM|nr:nucleoside deaminase [Peptoanaerobacter stomatis]EHL15908.1 hypothetical protein HMPREF9629_01622 [Peptoanaerobacter stomatis]EHL19189.1 hypothetical protein HMPREF9628_01702 [Peptoanaerobacter stomatis]